MTLLSDLIHRTDLPKITPATTVKHACKIIRDHHASAALIVRKDGTLLGIFTGRDAIWRVCADGKDPARLTLGDVMTAQLTTIEPKATAIEALRLMSDGGFRHLPVVDQGRPVGLVMRRDFKSEDLSRLEAERELWEHMR
jgi:CBS domain-containing protein